MELFPSSAIHFLTVTSILMVQREALQHTSVYFPSYMEAVLYVHLLLPAGTDELEKLNKS